ncbi:hypothetical protein BPAE_0143g00200 [Botrytis paeoniae]|uniref:N-acetyltransferase domain-containing protein n=1 Tax=Botrytis paeoniae TaxID=278948 RepID=A0A4Z1FJZ0_9HELO|nr:hypothetical protein BPAE_0143g00200 [Botrytis paeoniae]
MQFFSVPPSTASQLFYALLTPTRLAHRDAINALTSRSWLRHSLDKYSHWLYVTDPNDSDKIVGGGCWRIVLEDEDGEEEAIDPWRIPEGEKREYVKGIFEIWAEIQGRGKGAHCAVEVIFTSLSHRRPGIGNLILSWGTHKADELGLDCYVEGGLKRFGMWKLSYTKKKIRRARSGKSLMRSWWKF